MTYDPDDWKVGDVAWITGVNDDRLTPSNRGRHLRFLVRRPRDGASGMWSTGALHWVSTTTGAWVRADRPDLLTDAERAVVVTQAEAERINDHGDCVPITRNRDGSVEVGPLPPVYATPDLPF